MAVFRQHHRPTATKICMGNACAKKDAGAEHDPRAHIAIPRTQSQQHVTRFQQPKAGAPVKLETRVSANEWNSQLNKFDNL
eukprot:m.104324 g.104324  ORF g.104324 m.104324 type:complete len:81 (+) comp51590_c0_seq8:3-245(+)